MAKILNKINNAVTEHTQIITAIKDMFQTLKKEICNALDTLEKEICSSENIQALSSKVHDAATMTHINNVLQNSLAYIENNPTSGHIGETVHKLGLSFVLCLQLKLKAVWMEHIDITWFLNPPENTKNTGFLKWIGTASIKKIKSLFKPMRSDLSGLLRHLLSLPSHSKNSN